MKIDSNTKLVLADDQFLSLRDHLTLKPIVDLLIFRNGECIEYFVKNWRKPNSSQGVLDAILFAPYLGHSYFNTFVLPEENSSYDRCQKALTERLHIDQEFRENYTDFVIWSQLFLPTIDVSGVDSAVFANEVARSVIRLSELDRQMTWEEASYASVFAACIRYNEFFGSAPTREQLTLNLDLLAKHISNHAFFFDPASKRWEVTNNEHVDTENEFITIFQPSTIDVVPNSIFDSVEVDNFFRMLLRELHETPRAIPKDVSGKWPRTSGF